MKLLIVDDEQPARDRLRRLIDEAAGFEVAGEASNGAEAIEMVSALHPDVILLDIRMPGIQGIEVAHHLTTWKRHRQLSSRQHSTSTRWMPLTPRQSVTC